MVISQPPGNNHIIIVLHHASPNWFWMLQRQFYVLYMQYTSGNLLEMVLLSIFFTRIRSTEGSSADCSLFILSLHALALHLAVKILLGNLSGEDLSTLALHTSVGCLYFLPECQQDRTFCYATNTIAKTFLIFDINHQQTQGGQTRLKR